VSAGKVRAVNAETWRRILEPEPGTALARAKDFGIDLTLVARNAVEDQEGRGRRAAANFAMARTLREMRLLRER
jgi:hypothetical protein